MTSRTDMSRPVVDALLQRERIIITARLLPGVVHNLSGAVQMISLPLDLAQLALNRGESDKLEARLSSVRQGLDRLMGEVDLLAARSLVNQRRDAEPLDLAKLAGEQLDFWKGELFFKHELTLNRELSPDLGWPKASYADAALALNSILANAVDAVRGTEQPWVAVRNFKQDGWFGLEISDSGPGPSAQMAADLFKPFAGDKGGDHAGLGLFLAAEALEPWGGRVAHKQDAPHTTFVIELPAG